MFQLPYLGNPFTICTYVKLLCCALDIYTTTRANYTLEKKRKECTALQIVSEQKYQYRKTYNFIVT